MDKLVNAPVLHKPFKQSYSTRRTAIVVDENDSGEYLGTISKNVNASLICRRSHDGHWHLVLTHIQGEDVAYLLGRSFEMEEEMPLERLLPVHVRAMHSQRIDSILNEEYESEYWGDFFQKMMNRNITILNTEDQMPRLVSIFIQHESSCENIRVFGITLTDKSADNIAAVSAGSMKHNLATNFRAIINKVNEHEPHSILTMSKELFIHATPEQLRQLYDQVFLQEIACQERVKEISLLAYEGLQSCDTKRPSVGSLNIESEKLPAPEISKELILIEPSLTAFIEKRRVIRSHIKFTYANNSMALLECYKIDILLTLLWNLILTSDYAMKEVSVSDPEIMIRCFDETQEDNTIFHCDYSDNGAKLTAFQHQTFFANTGLRAAMPYKQWKRNKGEALVSGRIDAKPGTSVQLSCPAYSSQSLLLPGISSLVKNNALTGFILLVDDQHSILRIQMKHIGSELGVSFDYKTMQLSAVKSTDWAHQAFTTDILGSWGIICAANGRVAYEIVKQCPNINLVITDMEMPEMDGAELIQHIRTFERQNPQRIPARIVLNTGADKKSIESSINFEELTVEYMLKGAKPEALKHIISEVVQNTASKKLS